MNKKIKPRPVTHHALCDVAMEAYQANVAQSHEDLTARLEKAKEALHSACVTELKRSKRGRQMLAMLPEGRCTVGRAWRDDTDFIQLEAEEGSRLRMDCTMAMSRRLRPKVKAEEDLGDQRTHRRYAPDKRRAYVVEAVKADEAAFARIRRIVDKAVETYGRKLAEAASK